MTNTAIITNSARAWILAFRPKTLGAISCPILVGNALAFVDGKFSFGLFLLTLLCSVLLQILANVVNDYGDFKRGADTKKRLGPPRAMQMGFISEDAMQRGIVLIFALVSCLGLILVLKGGAFIFIAGLLSFLLCFWYTMGPRPLAYLGFAEVFILIFFGPLPVLGSYYLQTLSFSYEALSASISPALLSTALLMTNNLRDIEEDRISNKKTLAVRYGERFSRLAIAFLLILAGFAPLLLVYFFNFHWLAALAGLFVIGPLLRMPIILTEPVSSRFNLMLQSIGQSLYILGVLMSLGIIYGAAKTIQL